MLGEHERARDAVRVERSQHVREEREERRGRHGQRAGAPGLQVDAMTDLDGLTARLHAESATFGVAPESAGHHAGELETSIMLHLHPELVVADAMAPGYVTPTRDAQALFYPDVRRNAPDGVVGDPRGATALRGARYLDVWVDALEAALRR